MKRRIKMLCLCGAMSISLISCKAVEEKEVKEDATQTAEKESRKENGTLKGGEADMGFSIQADVNHDGVRENLVADVADDSAMKDKVNFYVESQDKTEKIYTQEIYRQEGNISYFLYSDEDGDYLLRYQPYIQQGTATYTYEVFYLNESGEEVTVKENSIGFETYRVSENFDIDRMVDFQNEVNTYLDKSTLLFECESAEIDCSESGTQGKTEEYDFIEDYEIDYSDCKGMKDKLNKYYEYVKGLEEKAS